MCGRYSLATTPAQLRERFALGDVTPEQPHYNVAPGTKIATVTCDRHGAPRGESLRWGFVPVWAKDPGVGFKMINARAETIAEKPVYRASFQRLRCLIPADGFYEWQARAGQPKQPFHITRADGQPFAFAGLWSVWHRGEDDELRTCTIITTAANEQMLSIHQRMPVILDPQTEAAWLDPGTTTPELLELLHSLSPDQTTLRALGTAVNNVRNDGPECLQDAPIDPGGAQETLFQ